MEPVSSDAFEKAYSSTTKEGLCQGAIVVDAQLPVDSISRESRKSAACWIRATCMSWPSWTW